jgi:ATP-binding cassette, subfamily C (CFTR/MRP), member 1
MEANFNSVERLRFYSELEGAENKPEVPAEMAETSHIPTLPLVLPPPNWPSEGKIRFENVQMRYRDGPLVLKGVSFDVKAQEKIGIAGRTG